MASGKTPQPPLGGRCRFATIVFRIRSPGARRAPTRGMFETMSATVLCFGEILLRLSSPSKELLLQSSHFDVHIGGAEANVAVSLSKLGHAAAIASSLPESP